MKRFNFNEEDDGNPEDDEYLEEMKFFMPSSEFVPMGNPNQDLLSLTIRLCEKSFFWKFYGFQKKIDIIKNTFENLKKIVENGEDENATL